MNKIVRAYHTSCGTAIYIANDGTWDGTEADAARFPQVEVGHDADGYEDTSHEEIVAAFKARGVDAEF